MVYSLRGLIALCYASFSVEMYVVNLFKAPWGLLPSDKYSKQWMQVWKDWHDWHEPIINVHALSKQAVTYAQKSQPKIKQELKQSYIFIGKCFDKCNVTVMPVQRHIGLICLFEF
jgi:ABC-type dipeptide/oligopeptide/nickel transport system permease component